MIYLIGIFLVGLVSIIGIIIMHKMKPEDKVYDKYVLVIYILFSLIMFFQ